MGVEARICLCDGVAAMTKKMLLRAEFDKLDPAGQRAAVKDYVIVDELPRSSEPSGIEVRAERAAELARRAVRAGVPVTIRPMDNLLEQLAGD